MKIYLVSDSGGNTIYVTEEQERAIGFMTVYIQGNTDIHLQIWEDATLLQEDWVSERSLRSLEISDRI